MKRRSVALALILSVCLAGCGSSSSSTVSTQDQVAVSTGDATTVSTVSTEAATESSTEASSEDDDGYYCQDMFIYVSDNWNKISAHSTSIDGKSVTFYENGSSNKLPQLIIEDGTDFERGEDGEQREEWRKTLLHTYFSVPTQQEEITADSYEILTYKFSGLQNDNSPVDGYTAFVVTNRTHSFLIQEVADRDNDFDLKEDFDNIIDRMIEEKGEEVERLNVDPFKDVEKTEDASSDNTEASTETSDEPASDDTGSSSSSSSAAFSLALSELVFSGQSVIDSTIDEAKQHDGVEDVGISVDESRREISVAIQVASYMSKSDAQIAGEDVARMLASTASYAENSDGYYEMPGSDDLGSLYDTYNLIITVYDSSNSFKYTGGKARGSRSLVWS